MNLWTAFWLGHAVGVVLGAGLAFGVVRFRRWADRRHREWLEDVQRVNEARRHA